ncbi:MAG: hypothetical protein U0Q16_23770 [Bryobacteraceae bacterium]
MAGKPAPNAPPEVRGFIRIGYRLRSGQYECIYLRPAKGHPDDQVRRNHSTQYASSPHFDFARLRKEPPEKHES